MQRQFFRAFFLLACMLLTAEEGFSQTPNVLVSEYYNVGGNPSIGEWTELFVLKDNLNLNGYRFHDDNATQSTEQEPITFNNPLWQNIRAGTIIVIWHRNAPGMNRDVDKNDGYIEVSAEDKTLFTNAPQTNPPSSNNMSTLVIAVTGDLLVIQDQNLAHVHGLGHINPVPIVGSWSRIASQYKINHLGELPDNSSLSVVPGRNIDDYTNNGSTPVRTSVSGSFVTMGMPNKSSQYPEDNWKFWEAAREPVWQNPVISPNVSNGNVRFTLVNKADGDDIGPEQGYLIVKGKNFPADFAPVDGQVYSDGTVIQTGISVVKSITAAEFASKPFIDNFLIPCGDSVEYRFFAYRYSADGQVKDANPKNARGRAYNENQFASLVVRNTSTAKPVITGAFQICGGRSATLRVEDAGNATVEWYYNGNRLNGENNAILITANTGKYTAKTVSALGCVSPMSDEVTVSAAPSVTAGIASPSSASVNICQGDSVVLTAQSGQGYAFQWQRDGSFVSSSISFTAKQPGQYRLIVSNTFGCSDTARITITQSVAQAQLSTKVLDFGLLSACRSKKDTTVSFVNKGSLPFTIDSISSDHSAYFAVSDRKTVAPGEAAEITVSFAGSTATNFGNLKIYYGSPCSYMESISLSGGKSSALLTSSPASLNFGTSYACDKAANIYRITLTRTGNENIRFEEPIYDKTNFTIVNNPFPFTLDNPAPKAIELRFIGTNDGEIISQIRIPYSSLGSACSDTIVAQLKAIRATPDIRLESDTLRFPRLAACEDSAIAVVKLYNRGLTTVRITKNDLPSNQYFTILTPVPFSLRANDSIALVVRYKADDYLPKTLNGRIRADVFGSSEPCLDSTFITFQAEREKNIYSSSADEINFGKIYACSDEQTPAGDIRINLADPKHLATITGVELEDAANYKVSGISAGESFVGEKSLSLRFTPTAFGKFQSRLTIRYCDGESTVISLTGEKTDVSQYEPGSGSYVFGTGPAGATSFLDQTIKNTSGDTLSFDIIAQPPAPFRIVSPAFPLRLAPGESKIITVEFAPADTGSYSDKFGLRVTAPCPYDASEFLLSGRADIRTGRVRLSLSDFSAAPDETVAATLSLSADDGELIPAARISKIVTKISYDASLLVPLRIRSTGGAAGFAALLSETNPGEALVTLSSDSQIMSEGAIAEIEFRSLLGASRTAELSIDSAGFGSDYVLSSSNGKGNFILTDNCSVGRRINSATGAVLLEIGGQSAEHLLLRFAVPTDGALSLTIYDSFGAEVQRLSEAQLKNGTYEKDFSTGGLAQGMYFAVLQAPGGIQRSVRFSVLK